MKLGTFVRDKAKGTLHWTWRWIRFSHVGEVFGERTDYLVIQSRLPWAWSFTLRLDLRKSVRCAECGAFPTPPYERVCAACAAAKAGGG